MSGTNNRANSKVAEITSFPVLIFDVNINMTRNMKLTVAVFFFYFTFLGVKYEIQNLCCAFFIIILALEVPI